MADQKISLLTPVTSISTSDTLVVVQGGVTKKCSVSQAKESFLQPFDETLTSGINTLTFSQSLGASTSDYDYIANLFDSEGNAYYDYDIEKIDKDSISVTVSDDNVNIKLIAYIL
jgi:hypothetical protein